LKNWLALCTKTNEDNSENSICNMTKTKTDEDMLPEYDFSNGVRGKHAAAYQSGYRIIVHKQDGSTEMAQENVLLLQAADGRQFVLTPVTDLQAFYVGESDELADEIAISRANQALMKFLDARGRQAQPGKGTSLEEVRRQLGL
jgi:hypothetical protein